MTAQRKNIKNDIETLDRILWLFKYKKDAFIGTSSESEYDKTVAYVKGIMDKLKDERQKLPIGYRYTGTFYLKKPYTIPSEAVKIKGSIYMREDLVSWVVESDDDYAKNLGYVRDAYVRPESRNYDCGASATQPDVPSSVPYLDMRMK